jgi:hypothetical protein
MKKMNKKEHHKMEKMEHKKKKEHKKEHHKKEEHKKEHHKKEKHHSKGEKKIEKVMREYKHGELHSGSKKGPQVKNRKQAIAIALSESRKASKKKK